VNAPIYLDYAATTPVDPAVARAMSEVLSAAGTLGNAASVTHVFGRRAAARIEAARAQVAKLIRAQPEDLLFTSGATESNNLAILGIARANADRGRHIVTSRIEHKAVLDPCKQLEREGFTVTYLAPNANGSITPDAVQAWLRPDTALVSIMHVNNETGVIQDIRAIGELCRARGVPFHTDAAQSVGKLPIRVDTLPVDLLSFTAHKIYGPQGIGALYVRPQVRPLLRPVTFGGGQERGLRPGTLAIHQIVGFGAACEIAARVGAEESLRIARLRDRLWRVLAPLDGVHMNGEAAPRVPEILNVSFAGVEGESLVTGLTSLAVTTGSACNSASGEPSYVLRALGRSSQLAQSSLRFSFGRGTTEAEVDRAAAAVIAHVEKLKRISPAYLGEADSAGSERQRDSALPAASNDRPSGPAARVEKRAGAAKSAAAESAAVMAPELDTLSPLARRYFDELPHAGVMTADGDGQQKKGSRVVHGEAGSIADSAWVRFHLRLAGGIVKAALFQAWGCPHTLAVTAWLTEQLPGRALTDLVPGTPAAWLETLDVPVEKLGRLFTVEDALKATLQLQA
jgi:cysteine desulfurase